jgi:pimeloyl-ACP methyl ester carboxylesterase
LVSHRDDGAGPVVVLLHAGVADGRVWEPQVELLAQRYRLIRPDLRGFGRTPLPPEPYTDADDVVALLDELGISASHVVGSSLGGRVALELAQAHAEYVASLVLLCPAFSGLEPTPAVRSFGQQEEALLDAGAIDEAVELNVETWLGPEASAEAQDLVRLMQKQAFDAQQAADSDPTFPWPEPVAVDPAQLSVPTLVVSGDHDLDHFQNVARYLASTIKGAELVSLPWAGHLPGLERPQAITELVLGFLAARGPVGDSAHG